MFVRFRKERKGGGSQERRKKKEKSMSVWKKKALKCLDWVLFLRLL